MDSIVSTTGATLSNSNFVRDDSIYVQVTPFDGVTTGSPVISSTLVISNFAPTAPTIITGPNMPFEGLDNLLCTISSSSVDLDGDAISYTFTWFDPDGNAQQSTTKTTLSDIFPAALTSYGLWTCSVHASDGIDTSATIQATVDVVANCMSHSDCAYNEVCAEWYDDGIVHCSTYCNSESDCQTGEICVSLPGGGNVRYCTPPRPNASPNGSTCFSSQDCEAGECVDGTCEAFCGGELDCGVTESCHPSGLLSAGELSDTCTSHTSLQGIGQSCLDPNNTNAGSGIFCETGHCDIHEAYYYQYASYGFEPYCRPLCNKDSDCDQSGTSPEACGIIVSATSPSSGVPSGINNDIPYSTTMGCYDPWSDGTLQTGASCTVNSECISNKCLNIQYGSSNRFCSNFCETDSDCSGGTLCRIATLNVWNEWMHFHSPFTPQDLDVMQTIVRICSF